VRLESPFQSVITPDAGLMVNGSRSNNPEKDISGIKTQ
jgi:hypothetical protein